MMAIFGLQAKSKAKLEDLSAMLRWKEGHPLLPTLIAVVASSSNTKGVAAHSPGTVSPCQ